MGDERRGRLVLRAQGVGVHAFVYPVDGGPFATAELTFPVSPLQELPRVEPGAAVTVGGTAEDPTVEVAGVTIRRVGRPATAEVGSLQILAERGDVIAHPDVVGWDGSWRTVRQVSSTDPQVLRRRYRRHTIEGWVMVAIGCLYLLFVVLDPGRAGGAWHAVYLVGPLAAWRAARRAHRALAAAEGSLAAPSRPARMRLWWSVGDGFGPVAVATLRFEAADAPVLDVPVAGVPIGETPEEEVEVLVHRRDDRPPIVRWGDHLLWATGAPVERRPQDR